MFGISYTTWKEICDMYFSLHVETHKAYLQWYPFSKLSEEDKTIIASKAFYNQYIKSGGIVFFPEVMRHTQNYIQKSDGSFRNATLISPLLYLVIQALGKEISNCYVSKRPEDISVYYAGNYIHNRPKYKQDYDDFYKLINACALNNGYFIKTDITSFFGNININLLIDRINDVCNKNGQEITQTQLLLLKELLLYCGDGYYPLIENSMASSYLATIIYLDKIDCDLYEFINSKVADIFSFKMIRYVDDLYILFSSEKGIDKLKKTYNSIKNEYSSILKQYGLSINTKKSVLRPISEINEELKRSQYDEYVNGIEYDLEEFFMGSLKRFLQKIYIKVTGNGLTNEDYTDLIEECFSFPDIEFTPEEVFNYLVYENCTELKQNDVSELLFKIIRQDVSFPSIDPKRISVMIMQSGNVPAIKSMLNNLFDRKRAGVWNSYDTTIAIAYLIQRKFQHPDLLDTIKDYCPSLYSYYYYACRISFLVQIEEYNSNRRLRCINNDYKASFLFFMSICERNRSNYLGAYAYYKSFFDRISADMAFQASMDLKCKRPDYNKYYKEKELIKLYSGIDNHREIIKRAQKLRHENPLAHSSSELLDKDSSSSEIVEIQEKLDRLIDAFASNNSL